MSRGPSVHKTGTKHQRIGDWPPWSVTSQSFDEINHVSNIFQPMISQFHAENLFDSLLIHQQLGLNPLEPWGYATAAGTATPQDLIRRELGAVALALSQQQRDTAQESMEQVPETPWDMGCFGPVG